MYMVFKSTLSTKLRQVKAIYYQNGLFFKNIHLIIINKRQYDCALNIHFYEHVHLSVVGHLDSAIKYMSLARVVYFSSWNCFNKFLKV